MKLDRRNLLAGGAALATVPHLGREAFAQTRAETLRQVTGNAVNTLDPTMPGSTREAFGISVNIYDRLVSFGKKQTPAGWVFDPDTIRGELAEKVVTSADGMTFTFHLRRDAKFHDGTPVTAEDVKWSLDRAVSARSLAAAQIQTGSWTKPEQFRIIDQYTVEAKVDKPDRLALPNLCTLYCIIFNSKVVKSHATAADPWGQEWTKTNTAGSGAYILESFRPGEQVILRRNDAWNRSIDGKPAGFRRVICQTIPEAATRASLIEKGDADLSIDLAASDVATLASRGNVKVISTPQFNAFSMIAFNTQAAPFNNKKLRQAIAAALPYGNIFKAALFERGAPLFGANWTDTPPSGIFPQPMPLKQDVALARKLLAEAGFPNGLDTPFAFNVGAAAIAEPMAALIKESLAAINVRVDIQKLPDAQISTMVTEKKLPFFTETSIAWLPSTDYFFRNFFTGNQRWNYSSWDNAEIVALAEKARFEINAAEYEKLCKKMISILAEEVPVLLLWQPNQDAVMPKNVEGYVYGYHRQVDYRDMKRA
ncbi:ABC transporter substrate-binding protein [Phreatobacter oligotrophus]|uniref:Peptide/nickel transport system substrate-binding protein n=1 Tax=Phreatobacter oligotrophus TaxID=1122261 RepID=A0A2T4YZK7_9HYPH|nr:ABC transporter substrate-binding protein [Phreatobacter oligotrophus]PTM52407.1 peptide/nickel transport system substrate-binding protein [Phreatobacter oligotrophus]